MKITIPGDPLSKMRPRFSRRGNCVYDSQSADKKDTILYFKKYFLENYEELTQIDLEQSFSSTLIFYLPIPISCSTSLRNAKLWHIESHIKKPDIDNMAKYYLDCMNQIFYKDDCQITSLHAIKIYSENPRTEIYLMPEKKLSYCANTYLVMAQFSPIMLEEFIKEMQSFRAIPCTNLVENPILDELAEKMCYFAHKYADPLKKIKKNFE